MDVVVEADCRAGGSAVRTTAGGAAAALDPHHVPVEALYIGAVEAQPHGAGQGGAAAAAIAACPTAAGPIPVYRGASSEGDSDRLLGADSPLTLLPLLVSYRKLRLTLPDLTQSALPHQLTVPVVIGHSARDAHPTCGGALGPLCGLWETAGLG